MSEIAIKVRGLGKLYDIGQRAPYLRLTETISHAASIGLRALLGKPRPSLFDEKKRTFWALEDVSFDVLRGEVLGIIGRNGAGKSTLLKVLSRITEPTTGDIWLNGRVGSLLEVGTGFHPELTGRENIFLNGSILGMKRHEIQRQFDEIVDFSELAQFLDTPVKHYSSGMYMRLAFSVAAHLEPEILLVDEVLAVGDAQFQAKCMGKMQEVGAAGRTVLFVSHNLAAIERLCASAIVLRQGRVAFQGAPSEAIGSYLGADRDVNYAWHREGHPPQAPYLISAVLCESNGAPCAAPTTRSQLGVDIRMGIPHARKNLVLSVDLLNELGHPILSTSPLDVGIPLPAEAGHFSVFVLFLPSMFLPKRYTIGIALYDAHTVYDKHADALSFAVAETASFGNLVPTGRIGDIQLRCDWSRFREISSASRSHRT